MLAECKIEIILNYILLNFDSKISKTLKIKFNFCHCIFSYGSVVYRVRNINKIVKINLFALCTKQKSVIKSI